MAWEPWDDDYYGRYYPPSRPLPAKGGIKARSQRGEFAASWWGRRWIAVLESFGLGARLNRGRSYARRGQVVHLEIKEGALVAGVQGSRADPYSVHIRLKQISNVQRGRLGAALADDIAIAARLMAGELPPELERCFAKVGAPLFPERAKDLITSCSCPDSSNPCKHIAAVFYLLAEEFDRNPFLLFELRGLARDEFTTLLGAAAGSAHSVQEAEPQASAAAKPLTANPQRFWHCGQVTDSSCSEVPPDGEAAPLAKRLGPIPFWRGDTDFLAEIGQASRQAAARALEILARNAE
ncbi:MAG: SWIM zinc finger family protein [Candidatus Binataceae bacterium]